MGLAGHRRHQLGQVAYRESERQNGESGKPNLGERLSLADLAQVAMDSTPAPRLPSVERHGHTFPATAAQREDAVGVTVGAHFEAVEFCVCVLKRASVIST